MTFQTAIEEILSFETCLDAITKPCEIIEFGKTFNQDYAAFLGMSLDDSLTFRRAMVLKRRLEINSYYRYDKNTVLVVSSRTQWDYVMLELISKEEAELRISGELQISKQWAR